MKKLKLRSGLVAGVFLAAGVAQMNASSMSLDVTYTSTFLPADGVYEYNFSVANCLEDDAFLVTLTDAPDENLIGSTLSAPTGYSFSYDPSFGLIDFLEGDDPNTALSFSPGSTVTDFTFRSAAAPGTAFTTFEAIIDDANFSTVTGQTTQVAMVPEPSSSVLLLGATLAFSIRRRRAA